MFLKIVINTLMVINVIVSLLIILLVLMQRPKNEGLGAAFGGGMTDNLFGAQTTNVLQTITRWLGGIFFALTLTLSWLYVRYTANDQSSIQQKLRAPTVIPATPTPAPAAIPGTPAPALNGTPGPNATPAGDQAASPAVQAPGTTPAADGKTPENPMPPSNGLAEPAPGDVPAAEAPKKEPEAKTDATPAAPVAPNASEQKATSGESKPPGESKPAEQPAKR